MMNTFRIRMMGKFAIYLNDEELVSLVSKTPKGCLFIQYLILGGGESVPNYRLISDLWAGDDSINPESALKTLISRLRVQLNAYHPQLGSCIVSTRGGYRWQCLPDMTVDVYQLEEIFASLRELKEQGGIEADPEQFQQLTQTMLSLYRGDLLADHGELTWIVNRSAELHNSYMDALYLCIDSFKKKDMFEDVATVCRNGLEIDEFDERLQIELMNALIKTGRTGDALTQYKQSVTLNTRTYGEMPSERVQSLYRQIVHTGKTVDLNLESIRSELMRSDNGKGAYVCDYPVFKEIYNLQIRNLERLGSTMFLAVIMVGREDEPMETLKQNALCNELMEIMRFNLRKGDTITRFSPTCFALLLPTVNYTTGNLVMERIKKLFFERYPDSDIAYSYRVGPLSTEKRL